MTSPQSQLVNQFIVAKDFVKMHTMPDHRVYAVKQMETVVEGGISCYTRNKGLIRDVVSSLAIRHIVLTRTGYVLVWMKPMKGFTLRLSGLSDVTTKTSALKYRTGVSWMQQRCLVKIHFPFGTLNLILVNGQIDKWRNAVIAACDRKTMAPVPTPRNALVETAASLSLVPLPQRCIITSSVVFHRPTYHSIDSMDEWRSDWSDVDTITPPSAVDAPFPIADAVEFNLPPSKTFHVTKNTVLPSSGLGTNDDIGTVPTADSDVSSDCVDVRERKTETDGEKGLVVKRLKRHTTCVELPVGVTLPIDNGEETGRSSMVDRWLRSHIEKRVRRLEGLAVTSEEIESDVPLSRPRSRSADSNMVSLRSKRYSLA